MGLNEVALVIKLLNVRGNLTELKEEKNEWDNVMAAYLVSVANRKGSIPFPTTIFKKEDYL